MKQSELEERAAYGSLKARLARGVTWNVVGTLFAQGTLFLCNILLANILGRNGFGEFGMIQSTILTLAGVAQLATGFTATKHVAEFRFTDKEKTGRILGICAVVSGAMGALATLVMLAGATWLATVTLKAPHLGTGLLIASGSVLFSVLTGYQVGALAGLESYGAIARIGAIHGVLHLAMCSGAAWLWGVNGALAGFVASALLRWLLFHRALAHGCTERGIAITCQGMWGERDIITRFALPAALSGLFSMPALWLVNTFLARLADGYSQLGMYSAANSLKTVILLLPQLINNVGMSLMNSQKGVGNQAGYRKLFWLNLGMTAGIVLAGVVFVACFGSWVLRLFGKDFVAGHTVLLILALSAIPEALVLAIYQLIQSRGEMWLSFIALTIPRDLTMVAVAYYLIPVHGAVGLATTYAISQLVALIMIIIIAKYTGIRIKTQTVPYLQNESKL